MIRASKCIVPVLTLHLLALPIMMTPPPVARCRVFHGNLWTELITGFLLPAMALTPACLC